MAIADAKQGAGSRARWRPGWPAVFVALVGGSLAVFSLFPGSLEGKSLAVLHGLCAQQPTHSYYFGEARLPFDARMTGIYSGFAMTCAYLLARGRWRAANLTQLRVVIFLALLVLPLAVDGVNSFLKDIELPYLYEPRNVLRTFTGLLLGTALASFIWLLVGQTAFRPTARTRQPIWSGVMDVLLALGVQLSLLAVVGSNWAPARVPLTYLLLLSATAVVTGLLLPFVLLAARRECAAREVRELAAPASLAYLAALLFIGALAGGRFLLEAAFGLPAQVT